MLGSEVNTMSSVSHHRILEESLLVTEAEDIYLSWKCTLFFLTVFQRLQVT